MKEIDFEQLLDELRNEHHSAASNTIGACVITDPQSGSRRCFQTNPQTCTRFNGKFIGGPCGPITRVPPD